MKANAWFNTVDIRYGESGLRSSFIGCAARFVHRRTVVSETPINDLRNQNEPRNRNRFTSRSGLTLLEMTVVISIAALMVGLTIPAANMLFNSFESESGAKSIVSAALASARAIAAKEQRYAGIRFQKRYDPNNPDPLNASQYMIFVIHDTNIPPGVAGNLGCRAVEGIEPIKLPDAVGVMEIVSGSSDIDDVPSGEVMNRTTFTILFSPSGKLIIHSLWIRNRDGASDSSDNSIDDIFNSLANITNKGIGMFRQDVRGSDDFPIEPSRNGFLIYEKKKFKQAYGAGNLWNGYLERIAQKPVYINPYTGTIVNEK